MTFKVSTNIGKSCEKTNSRYAISGIQVTPSGDESETVFLCATNGKSLAITEEDGSIDRQRIMPVSMSKTRKAGKPDDVSVNGIWRSTSGKAQDIDEDSPNFPPVVDVCPDPSKHGLTIALDVNLLASLAASIGSPDGKVSISIKVEDEGESKGKAVKPFIVTTAHNNNFGLIMPCAPAERLSAYSDTLKRFKLAQESEQARLKD